jgi:hypothetical protein
MSALLYSSSTIRNKNDKKTHPQRVYVWTEKRVGRVFLRGFFAPGMEDEKGYERWNKSQLLQRYGKVRGWKGDEKASMTCWLKGGMKILMVGKDTHNQYQKA